MPEHLDLLGAWLDEGWELTLVGLSRHHDQRVAATARRHVLATGEQLETRTDHAFHATGQTLAEALFVLARAMAADAGPAPRAEQAAADTRVALTEAVVGIANQS